MQLKVLSWNIWGGQYLPEVIKFLKTAHADIIGLQEVIEDLNGSNNSAKTIADELGYEWFFYPTYEIDTAVYYTRLQPKKAKMGNAILSRYPISETKAHQLSEEHKRFAVEALVTVKQKTLHIFSTRLKHTHQHKSSELQELQVRNLLTHIGKESTIVMGDFNASPENNCIAIVNRQLQNTDTTVQPTWAVYPDGCPVCNPQSIDTRLDYIFTTNDLTTHSPTVYDSKASDHLPISVILEI